MRDSLPAHGSEKGPAPQRSDFDLAFALSDRGNAQNEDFACVGRVAGTEPGDAEGLFGVLLDGATGVVPSWICGDGWRSDAQWLSHVAGELIARELAHGATAPDAVCRALGELQRRVSRVAGRPFGEVPVEQLPSATLAIALVAGGELIVCGLGDSPIAVRRASGAVDVLSDAALEGFDAANLRLMYERAGAARLDAAAKRALVRHELALERSLRNTASGYWIFDPTGAALPHMQVHRYALADVLAVAAFTDGMFAADAVYGLADLRRETGRLDRISVQRLIDRMRVVEAADPDLERYRRFKPSDDASLFQLLL